MCPGGPGPPCPALGDLARCSAQRYGFLQCCHILYPPGEHSKLVRILTQSMCSACRCDTAGRSESAAHQKKNDCHPKARGSGRTACPLDASMTAQVEVKLSGVGDLRVHGCACGNVPTLPNLQQHRGLISCGSVSAGTPVSQHRQNLVSTNDLHSLTWARVIVHTVS